MIEKPKMMGNHDSIAGKPVESRSRQNSFHRRFFQPISKAAGMASEAGNQIKSVLHIPEWQLMDYKPENSEKQEENNLYVTDWQMIG